MKLPERINNHTIETKSFKIFSNTLPDDWIIREVTERDYGIDCYVEICNDGFITGKLLSIQLKGSEKITFQGKNAFVTYYNLKQSTLNYWSKLPTITLFVYIDIKSEKIYFCNIRKYIRENYKAYLNETLTTIKIPVDHFLDKKHSEIWIEIIYFLESTRNKYEEEIKEFISNFENNVRLILNIYNLDPFLPLEDGNDQRFLFFYKNCKFLASRFKIDWNVESIDDEIEIAWKEFGECDLLYYYTTTKIIKSMLPIFKELINKVIEKINGIESEYWRDKYPSIWFYIRKENYLETLEELNDFKI